MTEAVSRSHVRRTLPTCASAARLAGLAGRGAGAAVADEGRPGPPASYAARSQNWYVVPLTSPLWV